MRFVYWLFNISGSEGKTEEAKQTTAPPKEAAGASTAAPAKTEKPPSPEKKSESKDHVIQIEEPESPSSSLYITKEEDKNLQKPISPTPSGPSEQILSASTLEADQQKEAKAPSITITVEEPKKSEEEKEPKEPKKKELKPKESPGPSRLSPSPAPPKPGIVTDKGKSKVTGKIVSGWL